MQVDFELYRHEVVVSRTPLVRLSVIDVAPERPLNTIVMLHGYGGNATQWKHQLRSLSDTHRCVAIDLRGHGRSDKPLTEYSVDELMADLHTALDEMAIQQPFILMGHSFGGALAVTFAYRYPESVTKLILIATADKYPLGPGERFLLSLPDPVLDSLVQPFVGKRIASEPPILKRLYRNALSRWNGRGMMRGLTMPVLIIRGHRDQVFPEINFDEVARLIPQAEEVNVGASAHLVILERHDAVERAIDRFLGLGHASWRSGDQEAEERMRLVAERPWLKLYEEGVPFTLGIPRTPLSMLLSSAARRFPTRPAVIFMNSTLSYRQLEQQVNRLANALRGMGVDTGTRVMILMPNLPQWIIAFYGVLRAGGAVVSASPVSPREEIIREAKESGARILITLTKFAGDARAVAAESSMDHIIFANVKDYLSWPRKLLFGWLREAKEGHRLAGPLRQGELLWTDVMRGYLANPVEVNIAPGNIALIQYTGGTTDHPKGVILSHKALVANALQTRHWVPNLKEGRERVLAVVPFAHVYGMTAAMNVAITLGAAMIVLPNFVTQEVLNTIKRQRPTLFPGVPTMYVALNNFPGVRRYNIRSIKACISGAAPLPVEVQETFERLTKGRLVEGYGLTEAGPVTHANPLHGQRKIGTIGVPVSNTEAKVVHLATGEDAGPGEIGELAVRGPQIMDGYLGHDGETEAALRDGWLYTGDIARMDSEGYFQIISRKKDMWYAERDGQPMPAFPRDVEEVIYEIPEVKEAAVVGIRNFPVAFVTCNRPIDAHTVINYVGRRLPKELVPRLVVFVDDMPRSFVGKIIRRHLLDKIPEPQRKELDIVSDRIDEMLSYPFDNKSPSRRAGNQDGK